ncbi:MAG: DUF3786 domain-containing protein [Thermodesulfobacteriota bacterium]
MPTGACGIDCDACRLKLMGLCSTCGSGTSPEGRTKLAAQFTILGSPCPILECAIEKHVDHCIGDCTGFPCERFRAGPYPFSEGFLKMQERRRGDMPRAKTPLGQTVQVPIQYWEDLAARDPDEICRAALAEAHPPEGFLLSFLNEPLLVDLRERCVKRAKGGAWEKEGQDLLELIMLVYLLGAKDEPLDQEKITVQELKDARFFQGPHELHLEPVLRRYGRDREGFKEAARSLGADPLDLADAAFRIQAFPRVPVYYLLWEGDEEFGPRLSVLFDRSVERHLSADGIWGLVHLVTLALVRAEKKVRPSGRGA